MSSDLTARRIELWTRKHNFVLFLVLCLNSCSHAVHCACNILIKALSCVSPAFLFLVLDACFPVLGMAAVHEIKAYAAYEAGKPLAPFTYKKSLAPGQVLVHISHCGVCHSDLHAINNGTRVLC